MTRSEPSIPHLPRDPPHVPSATARIQRHTSIQKPRTTQSCHRVSNQNPLLTRNRLYSWRPIQP